MGSHGWYCRRIMYVMQNAPEKHRGDVLVIHADTITLANAIGFNLAKLLRIDLQKLARWYKGALRLVYQK